MAPRRPPRFDAAPPTAVGIEYAAMEIRPARVDDAATICGIINYYAERGRMLHRSLESVYEALREFRRVAELSPGDQQAHFYLGLVALRQGRAAEAVDALREAAERVARPAVLHEVTFGAVQS